MLTRRQIHQQSRGQRVTNQVIGVTGCLAEMPSEFPLNYPENAGNMIHARAPLEMFPGAVYSETTSPRWGRGSNFRTWANENATHVVITLANFLRVNDADGAPYAAFHRQLQGFDSELVIFGLGAQAPQADLEGASMPPEAIELMRYLGDRCRVIGVRGEFTRKVFAHFAGVENTYITGCPSLFSRPNAFRTLRENSEVRKPGLRAYAGTVYHRDDETKMLVDSILRQQFLIEPVNRFNHDLHLASLRNPETATIPWYLEGPIKREDSPLTRERVLNYYAKFYRLFRNADAWYQFNEELDSRTDGSRFHVNMASVLSGVPAVWLTHDSRTAEMVEFLHLPNLPLADATNMTPEEIASSYDPTDLFDNIHSLFANFNAFLANFDLPSLTLDF